MHRFDSINRHLLQLLRLLVLLAWCQLRAPERAAFELFAFHRVIIPFDTFVQGLWNRHRERGRLHLRRQAWTIVRKFGIDSGIIVLFISSYLTVHVHHVELLEQWWYFVVLPWRVGAAHRCRQLPTWLTRPDIVQKRYLCLLLAVLHFVIPEAASPILRIPLLQHLGCTCLLRQLVLRVVPIKQFQGLLLVFLRDNTVVYELTLAVIHWSYLVPFVRMRRDVVVGNRRILQIDVEDRPFILVVELLILGVFYVEFATLVAVGVVVVHVRYIHGTIVAGI